jgi:hypothetical protein
MSKPATDLELQLSLMKMKASLETVAFEFMIELFQVNEFSVIESFVKDIEFVNTAHADKVISLAESALLTTFKDQDRKGLLETLQSKKSQLKLPAPNKLSISPLLFPVSPIPQTPPTGFAMLPPSTASACEPATPQPAAGTGLLLNKYNHKVADKFISIRWYTYGIKESQIGSMGCTKLSNQKEVKAIIVKATEYVAGQLAKLQQKASQSKITFEISEYIETRNKDNFVLQRTAQVDIESNEHTKSVLEQCFSTAPLGNVSFACAFQWTSVSLLSKPVYLHSPIKNDPVKIGL